LSLRLSAADDIFGLPRRGLLNEQGDHDKSKDDHSLAFTIDQMAKIDAAYKAAFPEQG
jgi:hypothetical protein